MTNPVQVALQAVQDAREADRLSWEAAGQIDPEELRAALEADGWSIKSYNGGTAAYVKRVGSELFEVLVGGPEFIDTQARNHEAIRRMVAARLKAKEIGQ